MTVPKSRRNEARTEYVEQATALASTVGQICSRLPKRWSFTRTQYILKAANSVMENAVRANAIYATNRAEEDVRMGHLLEALSSVYVLVAYLDQIAEDQPNKPCDAGKPQEEQRPCVSDGLFTEAAMRCQSCINLLKAVIRSDRRRWSMKRPVRRTSSRRSA